MKEEMAARITMTPEIDFTRMRPGAVQRLKVLSFGNGRFAPAVLDGRRGWTNDWLVVFNEDAPGEIAGEKRDMSRWFGGRETRYPMECLGFFRAVMHPTSAISFVNMHSLFSRVALFVQDDRLVLAQASLVGALLKAGAKRWATWTLTSATWGAPMISGYSEQGELVGVVAPIQNKYSTAAEVVYLRGLRQAAGLAEDPYLEELWWGFAVRLGLVTPEPEEGQG